MGYLLEGFRYTVTQNPLPSISHQRNLEKCIINTALLYTTPHTYKYSVFGSNIGSRENSARVCLWEICLWSAGCRWFLPCVYTRIFLRLPAPPDITVQISPWNQLIQPTAPRPPTWIDISDLPVLLYHMHLRIWNVSEPFVMNDSESVWVSLSILRMI